MLPTLHWAVWIPREYLHVGQMFIDISSTDIGPFGALDLRPPVKVRTEPCTGTNLRAAAHHFQKVDRARGKPIVM